MTPDAVADRSVELDDRSMISFLETPMPLANAAMEYWTIETLIPQRSNPPPDRLAVADRRVDRRGDRGDMRRLYRAWLAWRSGSGTRKKFGLTQDAMRGAGTVASFQ